MTLPTLDHYTSSDRGSRFVVTDEKSVTYTPIVEDHRVFSKDRYASEVHAPVILFPTRDILEGEFNRCLDLPIRLRSEEEYAVPEEWAAFLPIIEHIAQLEHGSNASALEDYYTYLTVDSSWVEAGQVQRNEGLHVDGFQGARIQPKTKITRNYIAASNGSTVFYPQTFDLSLDDSKYNLFLSIEDQAGKGVSAPEHAVVFMDAYCAHASGPARYSGWRTFLRVTYDCKRFDRSGNSHNAMLAYEWDMVERNIHEGLATPPRNVPKTG